MGGHPDEAPFAKQGVCELGYRIVCKEARAPAFAAGVVNLDDGSRAHVGGEKGGVGAGGDGGGGERSC